MTTEAKNLAVMQAGSGFAVQIDALKRDVGDGKKVPYDVLTPTGKQAAQALEEQREVSIRFDKDADRLVVTKLSTPILSILNALSWAR